MARPRLLLDWISLDGSAALPLYRQLYFEMRKAMVSGRLPAGSLLPGSRTLCRELGVSRNTVMNAYDQLVAEGFLEASEGSATVVARLARVQDWHEAAETRNPAALELSRRGIEMTRSEPTLDLPGVVAFAPGVPAFDQFPTKNWVRLLSIEAIRMEPEMADNDAHIGGFGPLRDALASYLRTSRQVDCESDQVFVVSSARAGLDLVCRLVADPGASCLMEEPGYVTAKSVLRAAGLRIVPVPVDAQGLRIDAGAGVDPKARLAFVTPSHQWPTGSSLSAARRQLLLDWAERTNAWVVEDDYDSEFRFDSRPLATLQGLDGGRRVIYIGTFSKVLFPSLRTAYVVVPRALIPAFQKAIYYAGQEPPLHIQAALSQFIQEGYFFSHIRRMRRVYKRRQRRFVDSLTRYLGNRITIQRPAGGMQMMLPLPSECVAEKASQRAKTAGLHARPVTIYALTPEVPNALHLGFAAIPDMDIETATKALAAAILATA